MKEKGSTKISLGRKHVWTDTAGHAHRVVFDQKAFGKPRLTWCVLASVTVFALAVGSALIYTSRQNEGDVGAFRPLSANAPQFQLAQTLAGVADAETCVLASGWNDEFFLADASGVSLYDASGEKLGEWSNDEETAPTALCFVGDEASALNGTLLIAYADKVKALRFALDEYTLEDANAPDAPRHTARKGAQGAATLVLSIPDANIRGIASSSDKLFVADSATERVWRYSWEKLNSLKEEDGKKSTPDCELGAPDVALKFPGMASSNAGAFNVQYVSKTNELFVVNSALFRVDVFNASSGGWIAERSWSSPNGVPVDEATPELVSLFVSSFDWVATGDKRPLNGVSDAGSPLQLFSMTGESLGAIQYDASAFEKELRVTSLAGSDESGRLYALCSDGSVMIFEQAR